MKQAAAAATDVYKEYNKKASFVNLEMVNEWLSTRGEYSFRRDKNNRLQLDISIAEENQVIPADHQKIFSCSEQDKVWVQMSSALVPDGVSKASLWGRWVSWVQFLEKEIKNVYNKNKRCTSRRSPPVVFGLWENRLGLES